MFFASLARYTVADCNIFLINIFCKALRFFLARNPVKSG